MHRNALVGTVRKLCHTRWVAGLLAAIALGTIIGSAAAPQRADAASTVWRFRNAVNGPISVRIYSQSRNWVWPSTTRVFTIPATGIVYQFQTNCHYGEKMCFGAWLRYNHRIIWGVGPTGRHYCSHCCFRCLNNVIPPQRLQ